MGKAKLTLITGRTTRQGAGISVGKGGSDYREATGVIELSLPDMTRAELRNGDAVRITTQFGSTEVTCRSADLPEGLAFMAFGPACNCLVGNETHASGMPDSKHILVEIAKISLARPE